MLAEQGNCANQSEWVAQQILAELVESVVLLAQQTLAELVERAWLSSRATAESSACLLNIVAEPSVSRPDGVRGGVSIHSKIYDSSVLNQKSRLIEWVIVIGTVVYCQSSAKIQTLVQYGLEELCNSIALLIELSTQIPTLFSLDWEPHSRTVLSSGSDTDPCAIQYWSLI